MASVTTQNLLVRRLLYITQIYELKIFQEMLSAPDLVSVSAAIITILYFLLILQELNYVYKRCDVKILHLKLGLLECLLTGRLTIWREKKKE